MTKAVIFDLDGTLWDPGETVTRAYNETLICYPETAFRLNPRLLKSQMGKTAEEIAKVFFTDVDEARALELMKICSKAEQPYVLKYGGVLFNGVERLLKEMSKEYALIIVSNCTDGYIQAFMKYHKLEKYISDIECHGRTGLTKGENIKLVIQRNSIKKAVYIGDTQGDCDAALFAGVPFIYAEYGFGTVTNPDYSAKAFTDIPGIVKAILD